MTAIHIPAERVECLEAGDYVVIENYESTHHTGVHQVESNSTELSDYEYHVSFSTTTILVSSLRSQKARSGSADASCVSIPPQRTGGTSSVRRSSQREAVDSRGWSGTPEVVHSRPIETTCVLVTRSPNEYVFTARGTIEDTPRLGLRSLVSPESRTGHDADEIRRVGAARSDECE